ncbi:MAG: GGDEF domain-containing protein [Ilumatobacteraceae bacterium]|nr:GGDEF domain-containing protein [Ilumatobacteraceae bacterium]
MTTAEQFHASDADMAAPSGSEIVAVANAASARADHDSAMGELVIVARTADGGHRAIGGGGVGPLRAAISVAVAAENARLWSGVEGTETIERSTRSMPEIVRTAAEASNITTAHVGCIIDDAEPPLAAVAVWFEVDGAVAGPNDRRSTMELLAAAAERQRRHFAAKAAERAANAPAPEEAPSGRREFDADDPSLDSVTGLATRADFESAMDAYESDEATLVVVDLDGFAKVPAECGDVVADAVLREIADRMVSSCRRDDLIARIGPDTFAILFADAPRSVGLHIAKRLLDTIAMPLPIAGGPEVVTATVALAHQFGLVDMEELMESADDAVASGKRSGTGRLVIAS